MTPLLVLALLPALALAGPLSYYYTPSLYAHDDSAVEVPLVSETALYYPAGAQYPFALRTASHYHPTSTPIADVFFGNEEAFLRRRRRPNKRPNRKPVDWNHVAQSAADITHDVTNTVNQIQQQPQLFARTVFLQPADAIAADDISFIESFPHPVVRTPVPSSWGVSPLHSHAF